MVICLLPISVCEYYSIGHAIEWRAHKPDLEYPIYGHVIIAGLGWSMNVLFWIVALEYTTTVKATLIANMHPLLLVLYIYFIGDHVAMLDWIGVIVSVIGVITMGGKDISSSIFHHGHHSHESSSSVSSPDGKEDQIHQGPYMEIFGFVLAGIACVGELIVILNRKKIKKYVPLMQV